MWFYNSGTASTNGVWRRENTGKAFPGVLKLLSENADLAHFVAMGNTAWLTLFSTRGSRPGRPSQIPIRTTDIKENRLSPLFPNPDSSVSGHLTISHLTMVGAVETGYFRSHNYLKITVVT